MILVWFNDDDEFYDDDDHDDDEFNDDDDDDDDEFNVDDRSGYLNVFTSR